MKYLCVFGAVFFLAAAASAQNYRMGEYYEPYGSNTAVGKDYDPYPYRYSDRTYYYPDYYPRRRYYPRSVRYGERGYRPRYYDPWWYRRDDWDSPRWDSRYHHPYYHRPYHGHHDLRR